MGWSLTDWLNLPDAERIDWLAYEHQRREKLRLLLKNIQYDKEETDANGAPATKHYVHDYGAYIDILRELSGL